MGIVAAPKIAELLPLYEPTEALPTILPTFRPPLYGGESYIQGINLLGVGEKSAAGLVRILRQDGNSIIEFALNAWGGTLVYVPRPEDRIVFSEEHPIIIECSEGLRGDIPFYRQGAPWVRQFSSSGARDLPLT
jgi:hypothetical protein